MFRIDHRVVVSSLALAAATLSLPAAAQTASGDEAASIEQNSGVIIVTAQKREQNVLDVPIAVSVLGQEVLDVAQVNDFDDITNVSPSLTITRSGNQNQNVIALRGVGTFSFSTAVESAVQVVVDDVALLQPGQAFGNLTDIARIEVLRGPQGTLFGRNASAGVINIVTQDPTSELSGYVEGLLTDDDEYRVNAMISGPIGSNGGFRLNGYYADFGGFINNLETGNTLGASESWGVRGKMEFSAGRVDFSLVADYSESHDNAGIDTYRQLAQVGAAGNPVNQSFAPALVGVTPGPENLNVRINDESVNDTEQFLTAAKWDLDLDFATLSSISSYQFWNYYAENDQDFSPDPSIFQFGPLEARQFSQELRLTSPTSGPFDYLVGLFYSNATTDRDFNRRVPNFLGFLRQNWDSVAKTESMAAFAQLGYDITSSTLLTAGARVNRENISVQFDDQLTTPSRVFQGSDSETAFTWRVALQQFVGDGLMVFGSVSSGYKGQAYDISSGFDQRRADNPIQSEDSINYEIGVKGQAFNNLAQFQLVGFWTDYNNFQAQGINNDLPVAQFELTNVGKLRTRGVEFEGQLKPTENITLFGSAAYVDAKIQEFPGADCYFGQTAAQGCAFNPAIGAVVQDLAGQDLSNSPDFKFNVGFNVKQPVSSGIEVFISGNYVWQSEVNFSLTQNPRTIQDSYGIANASVGIQDADQKWRVTLFVNNLFDENYVNRIIDDTSARVAPFILLQQPARNADRYFGARVRFGF